jgi:hypothetical protein
MCCLVDLRQDGSPSCPVDRLVGAQRPDLPGAAFGCRQIGEATEARKLMAGSGKAPLHIGTSEKRSVRGRNNVTVLVTRGAQLQESDLSDARKIWALHLLSDHPDTGKRSAVLGLDEQRRRQFEMQRTRKYRLPGMVSKPQQDREKCKPVRRAMHQILVQRWKSEHFVEADRAAGADRQGQAGAGALPTRPAAYSVGATAAQTLRRFGRRHGDGSGRILATRRR